MSHRNNSNNRFSQLVCVLLLFCLTLFKGCEIFKIQSSGSSVNSSPEYTGPPVYGGTYYRAFSSAILTLDPREITDAYSHEVARPIFEGLVEFDLNAQVIPAIAESWNISDDRLTYTFKIRKNCRFHATNGPDNLPTKNLGRAISAEDVEYTFLRLLDPEVRSPRGKIFWVIEGAKEYNLGDADRISGITVLASDTISFKLVKPFSPFVSLLALSNAFIVPKEDVEFLKERFAKAPVGAGPFVWAGSENNIIRLRANPNYYRGRPYLDEIVFSVNEDEMARFNDFKNGKLSETDVPDPEYKNIKTDPFWSKYFQEQSRWGTQYLGFNVTKPPFDNVKVRQALNYAVDRETIVKLILNDRGKIAQGVLPPGIMGYNPKLKGYSFDPEKARKLLAEAGFPNGKGFPKITLQINKDSMHTRIGEFLMANFRDIGIDCALKEVDFAEHIKTIAAGEVPFFRLGWTVDFPDPDNFLHTLFHSSNFGMEGNFCFYKNPVVDDLLDRARFEITPKDRIDLYQRAEQIIVDEAPWIFFYHFTTHVLTQPNVRGLEISPMGKPFVQYRKIWLAPVSTSTKAKSR